MFNELVAMDPRFKNRMMTESSPKSYLKEYYEALGQALDAVPEEALDRALDLLQNVRNMNKKIIVAGNGGSAAVAEHLTCDWMKGTRTSDGQTLRVVSLVSNVALNSALANDFGFENALSVHLEMIGEPGDVIVLVSSSGNSPNILKAIEVAKKVGISVIGMSGFKGGQLHERSDVSLFVPYENYGLVEDAHQMLMHVLAQTLVKRFDRPSSTRI
jgi:D-sedoheptulose 7-phosphate isomerase